MTMVETTSVREERPKLSARDRLCLIQTINALPPTQFDELVFALNPPKGVVSPNNAPQGQRSKDLLDWLEGSSGPGLVVADEVLQILIPKATKTAPQPLAFVISGKISSSTAAEVQAFVELLRKKTGDNSIDIAFFQEGSIKVILNGSLEGLAKLQEMFESGELEQLDIPPVEAITSIDSNGQDALKARLIQVLRLTCERVNRARALAITLDNARNLVNVLDRTRAIIFTLALALPRDRDNTHNIILSIAQAFDYSNDLTRARYLAHALVRELDNSRSPDLSNADLSGVNLSYLNLERANLIGADLTHANVTGTIFGDNPGLIEADKRDLQRRGAIIQDPPSSDVPALALR